MYLFLIAPQLLQQGQFTRSVAIVRPRGKDFNEDLKTEQLRQVKRPILLINPQKGQIINRFANEEDARQFIDKELIKSGKLEAMPVGSELRMLKTNTNQLKPTVLGKIRVTATGLEKDYTEAFKSQANRQGLEPKASNEQSL